MTQPAPFTAQIERAWHHLMRTMAVTQPNRVNSGRIVLKALHAEMKRRGR